jgi:transcriptional regulator with XRE-family HTH domain
MRVHEYIALELKRYRDSWGLTQRQVAIRAGTTQRIIAQIEGGKYNPTAELMERIAGAFGMRLEVAFKPRLSEYTHKGKSGSTDV